MGMASHVEKLVAGLGGALSIFIVYLVTETSQAVLQYQLLFVASMGASAVLLFATPHSPLAQPWNVIGGHVISTFLGVCAHQFVANPFIAGGLGVGLAITTMYYLNCLHPPGGASALVAAMGGASVESFGFLMPLFPIGFSALLMVLTAVLFNYGFPWRRYPVAWQSEPPKHPPASKPAYPDITHADLVAALSQIDGFVDVSEQDLLRIYELATNRQHPALEAYRDDEDAD